ncbi:MAG: hypothetical protein PHF37_03275 [Phycisphaerae bacterium]|jgi:hypothetical protein|nr:hypothetical protein [Phycisphaerae bacterium]
MAANTFNIVNLPFEGSEFFVSFASEEITDALTLVAAVSGKSHHITRINVRTDAAMDINIGSGVVANAITTTHIGPVPLAAGFGFFGWRSPEGKAMKLTSGAALGLDSTADGTIWVEVWGRTCKD